MMLEIKKYKFQNLTFDNRRLDLMREKVEGDRGEDGVDDHWNNFGLLLVLQ